MQVSTTFFWPIRSVYFSLNYLILYDLAIHLCIKHGDYSKAVHHAALSLNAHTSLGWFGCRFKEEHGTKCFICKTKSTSDTCIYIPNINLTDSILSLEYYLQRCSPNMKKCLEHILVVKIASWLTKKEYILYSHNCFPIRNHMKRIYTWISMGGGKFMPSNSEKGILLFIISAD